MNKYYIYFEGTLEIDAEDELTEEEIIEMSEDIIYRDARTHLDNDCSIDNIEVIDMEKYDD